MSVKLTFELPLEIIADIQAENSNASSKEAATQAICDIIRALPYKLHPASTLTAMTTAPSLMEASKESRGLPTHIAVKVSNASKEVVFRVKPTALVRNLKDAIRTNFEFAPHIQILLFDGSRMDGSRSWESHGVRDGDRIELHTV